MQVAGEMIIGRSAVLGKEGSVKAVDPSRNVEIEPAFGLAGAADLQRAVELANAAFDVYRETGLEARAKFLETIADRIMDLGPTLIERAMQETGLPQARLEGERGRTCTQLRLFAKVVRDGRFQTATLDSALPDRAPAPRPDLRLRKIGLGPVAVFGASNFPLAFSVAGGDTASALAAGCPVIVKAHSAHLGTSELVGKAVAKAVEECNLPEGVFSMLIGSGQTIGQNLVAHPYIKAVGFTGSRAGGVALMHTAAARKEPIPVYAEMSSINPVFLLPGALDNPKLPQAFADSLTLGAGQFCTNPGLLIGLKSDKLQAFVDAAAGTVGAKPAQTMLTPGIHKAYTSGVKGLAGVDGVKQVAIGQAGDLPCGAQAFLYQVDAKRFLTDPALEGEIFGPTSLLVVADNEAELLAVAEHLEGQLTGAVHATADDKALATKLLPILERKVGRILFNGFGTGVEVAHAMVHGGPFPSTSDSRTTSVGASAIDRFLRPVSYQDVPAYLLPESLQDANPQQIPRVVNGDLVWNA
ncbi:aldehyde dehydrogenase family protein [Duganella sp. FT50W]|uniref:2,5-dioxovalerate dehydrogenase n=1 Tax=Duganella lactea TaxID=2692173 RepID=A0A6L8MG45_9BURK|nr:aldehyde dehydrogenase (NADP(+)) [Duganella lactea]MYM34133.1 aldehyde dehydrogenase family protein [Duganella lactea]MYM81369.1 aldehyde dehydrogenase family protein [Duganella lactea]